MARLEFSVEIAAPPDRVFVFFVPQRMPHWYGAEMDAHLEVLDGAQDFAVGQKVQISGTLGRRGVGFTAVVTRYEWLRLLEWQFQDAYGVRGLQRWELEPIPGGTRVRMVDEYTLPGLAGRIMDALVMRWSVARRDRAWLARLQRLAEGIATTDEH